jgi:hypothetical protein
MAVKILMLVFWVVMPCGDEVEHTASIVSLEEYGVSMSLQNVCIYLKVHKASQPSRPA